MIWKYILNNAIATVNVRYNIVCVKYSHLIDTKNARIPFQIHPGCCFSDLSISYGSTDNKLLNFLELEACKLSLLQILKEYCEKAAEERWVFLTTTPSRTSENTLLVHRVKVAIIIDICSQNYKRS